MTAVKTNAQEVQSAPQSVHGDDREIIVLDILSVILLSSYVLLEFTTFLSNENAEVSSDILDTRNENSKNEANNQTAFLSYSCCSSCWLSFFCLAVCLLLVLIWCASSHSIKPRTLYPN